jgi:membrane associated rhomboid family serine protease
LLLYPRVRVHMLVLIFILRVPAWLMLLWWVGLQLAMALPQLASVDPAMSDGVAVWAHIGGFATGLVLVRLFVDRKLIARRTVYHRVFAGY